MAKYKTEELRAAALACFEKRFGDYLRRPGIAQIYEFNSSGKVATFRLRTTNDRNLVCSSKDPRLNGPLDIDGVDWILLAMPATKRKRDHIQVYWLDARMASDTVKSCHLRWLEKVGKTAGANMTPALYFDNNSTPTSDDYAHKWRRFRIDDTSTKN